MDRKSKRPVNLGTLGGVWEIQQGAAVTFVARIAIRVPVCHNEIPATGGP